MSLWKIAWRSIQQRALSSTLTCVSMALGVALVVTVLLVHSVVNDYFNRGASLGYHLVVGGKNGSKLELVLSTVYHIYQADEPMPWSYYKEFITSKDASGDERKGKFAGLVSHAVPVCLGDTYQEYRVIATTREMFKFEYTSGKTYAFAEGRNFYAEHFFEAVIGAEVSRATGLSVGDTFKPTHGIASETAHVHEDKFEIVGVLQRTGTPNDRAMFINIEGFFLIEDHAKEGRGHEGESTDDPHDAADDQHENDPSDDPAGDGEQSAGDDCDETATDVRLALAKAEDGHAGHAHPVHHTPLPESQREVTAILLDCGDSVMGDMNSMALLKDINEGRDAQAVQPVIVVRQFLTLLIGPVRWLLLGLTVLTVVVASIGVMVSIYNSMSGRRHEIAIMRALGAGRSTVMLVVLMESVILSLGGGLVGILLGHVIMAASSPLLESFAGISAGFLQFERNELILIPALIVLATVVGYLPAVAAYRTDVARSLTAGG